VSRNGIEMAFFNWQVGMRLRHCLTGVRTRTSHHLAQKCKEEFP
jgi:hypothetical protein